MAAQEFSPDQSERIRAIREAYFSGREVDASKASAQELEFALTPPSIATQLRGFFSQIPGPFSGFSTTPDRIS